MFIYPYAIAALVVAGVAGAASLAAHDSPPADTALICALSLEQSGPTVTLRAEAESRHATAGTYTLTVEQTGRGGGTRIRQGGEMTLPPGTRVTLGEARFSGHARDLSAELTLDARGTRRTCTDFSL